MAEPAEAVHREARQLVEAAARWLSAVPDRAEYAGTDPDPEGPECLGPDDVGPLGEDAETTLGPPPPQSEEHLCKGCPWCRAKAAAGPIGADTLDSLASLLGAAAESLALFAQSRRDAAHAAHDGAAHDGDTDDDVSTP